MSKHLRAPGDGSAPEPGAGRAASDDDEVYDLTSGGQDLLHVSAPAEQADPLPSTDHGHDAPAVDHGATRRVTCPECGATTAISLNRRQAGDFCPTEGCDYPLFYLKDSVIVSVVGDREPATRRRPGVGGHEAVAFRRCPWPDCGEPNPPRPLACLHCGRPTPAGTTACAHCRAPIVEDCQRCGRDIRETAPPPPPRRTAPPPPAPVVEPVVRSTPWWWWVLGGLTALMFVVVVLYLLLRG